MLDPGPNPVTVTVLKRQKVAVTCSGSTTLHRLVAVGGGAAGMCVVGKGNGTGV